MNPILWQAPLLCTKFQIGLKCLPQEYDWKVKDHHWESIKEKLGNKISERKEGTQGNREYAMRIQLQGSNNNDPIYQIRCCLDETR